MPTRRREWLGWLAAVLLAATLLLPVSSLTKASDGCRLGEATPSSAFDLAPYRANLAVIGQQGEVLARHGIARIELGELVAKTGCILATDPLVQPERPAFRRGVPPGRYPVTLYWAQGRVALAALRLAPGEPASWELATIPAQDMSKLKADEYFGYPVDAGLGSFMDEAGQAAMVARIKSETALGHENYYDDVLSDELDLNHGEYVMHRPLADDPDNVAVFHSGWGDGSYPSFWGLDAAGKPLLLVTDFGVLENGDGRTDRERWFEAAYGGLSPAQKSASHDAFLALKAGDLAALGRMLASGAITPETPIEDTTTTFTYEAIDLDKPEALRLLIADGAPQAMPKGLWLDDKSYPDFARHFAEPLPKGFPDSMKPMPRSAALMALVKDWDTRARPAAAGTP